MADDKKLILGVGDYYGIAYIGGYFEDIQENRFVVDERVANVTDAMKKIDSGNYWGVLMNSLVLHTGSQVDKYNEKAKKFAEFDYPPMLWRSGGLYVVEQACDKGLFTVVNAIDEDGMELGKATELGAKCFTNFRNFGYSTLEYFRSCL